MRAPLITDPQELRPETPWAHTAWAWTAEEQLIDHTDTPRLCVAALLPFAGGQPDWDGFIRSVGWMRSAAAHFGVEIVFVLNADTGYLFHLEPLLYAEVLRRFREEFPQQRFIAGVTARGAENDATFESQRYQPLIDLVQVHENCEVMLMTSPRLAALDPERRLEAYEELATLLIRPALVHALEPAFVPWARPFEPWLLYRLARHPAFIGGKVSTLSDPHFLYWASMCQSLQLPFIPHSGDDFGLATAIKLGLPLLVGAGASAAPLLCAALDLWRLDTMAAKKFPTGTGGFDCRVYKLFEALQSFTDAVFRLDERGSAAAYKHSTAHVLHLLGLIAAPEAHPACRDLRGPDEAARMREALERPLRMARELDIPGFAL